MKGFIPKKLIVTLILIAVAFAGGTLGYVLIEDAPVFDSLYMTVITLTTVGYGETIPLSQNGRIFTMFLLLSGFGILTYGFTAIVTFLFEGELGHIMRRRKMENCIDSMRDHYIVCATGEMGEYVIEEIVKTQHAVAVVTLDEHLAHKLTALNVPVIKENPAEDEVLKKAGIERARGLVSVLNSDKDNLFVVLSARGLNPLVRICSRAIEKNSVPKLKKAGADEVVLTDYSGGMRIASVTLRPKVVSFLDIMLRDSKGALRVEEATIVENSQFDKRAFGQCGISEKTGLVVVALKNGQTGEYIHNPAANYKLAAGDTLIVIGSPEQVQKLSAMANS